jgi:hypothetical protein
MKAGVTVEYDIPNGDPRGVAGSRRAAISSETVLALPSATVNMMRGGSCLKQAGASYGITSGCLSLSMKARVTIEYDRE